MPAFRAPRGTRDLLPEDRAVFDRLTSTGTALAMRYGYRPIETPMFEQASVFERGIGSVTDVVEKELFRIAPRSEEAEAWALRPEPTRNAWDVRSSAQRPTNQQAGPSCRRYFTA